MHKVDESSLGFAAPALSAARCEMWLPRASLSTLVRAVMSRDTRAVALASEQRYNHLPATPLCSIIWYLTGEAELLAPGYPAAAASPREPLPGRVIFCGPFSRPTVSWNPGPMHVMALLLQADALAHLLGIDPGDYVNRIVPAAEVFDGEWLAMCAAVQAAPDDDARVALIEQFLDPLWQRRRPESWLPARAYADWTRNLMMRAANSGLGRSLRQVERRIKHWAGLPLRELHGISRAERVFFDAVVAERSGRPNWSELADGAGYSDQSHLCRQTVRITGFPPEELRRRTFEDEGFWAYRLWGMSEQPLRATDTE